MKTTAFRKKPPDSFSITLDRRPSADAIFEIIKQLERKTAHDEVSTTPKNSIEGEDGTSTDVSFHDFLNCNGCKNSFDQFSKWTESHEVEFSESDDDCSTFSESLCLAELVGDDYLDAVDTNLDIFKEQLSQDMDILSGKVYANYRG